VAAGHCPGRCCLLPAPSRDACVCLPAVDRCARMRPFLLRPACPHARRLAPTPHLVHAVVLQLRPAVAWLGHLCAHAPTAEACSWAGQGTRAWGCVREAGAWNGRQGAGAPGTRAWGCVRQAPGMAGRELARRPTLPGTVIIFCRAGQQQWVHCGDWPLSSGQHRDGSRGNHLHRLRTRSRPGSRPHFAHGSRCRRPAPASACWCSH